MSLETSYPVISEGEGILANDTFSSADLGLGSGDLTSPNGSGCSTPKFILPICEVKGGGAVFASSSDEDEDRVFDEDEDEFPGRPFKANSIGSAGDFGRCGLAETSQISRSLDFSTVNIPSGKLLSPAFTPSPSMQSLTSVGGTSSLAGGLRYKQPVRVRPAETKVMSAARLDKFKNERMLKLPLTSLRGKQAPGEILRMGDSISNPCSPTSSPPFAKRGRQRAWSFTRSPGRDYSSSWSPERSGSAPVHGGSRLSEGGGSSLREECTMCDVLEEE